MSYSTVSMGLRPPRVVVVFDGGERWTYWARRALHLAGRVWGGSGFALVPHRRGKVDPTLLRACRAYDPDYVVVCPLTVRDAERIRPGLFDFTSPDGESLTGSEREKFLTAVEDQPVDCPADVAACDRITEFCSVYRTKLDGESWHEDVTLLETGSRSFHDALSVAGVFSEADLVLSPATLVVSACPPSWGGVLGVLAASHAGVVEDPDPGASDVEVSRSTLNQLTSWIVGPPDASAPEELVWRPDGTQGTTVELSPIPPAHIRSLAGLVTVTSSPALSQVGLVVVGDSPEDFALARIWQLTFGFGLWLPSMLGVDQDAPPPALTSGLRALLRRQRRDSRTLHVTSTSRPTEQVRQVRDRLFPDVAAANAASAVLLTPIPDLPWRQTSTTHLAVAEEFDTYVTVPTSVDETGTRSMAAPLPVPSLKTERVLAPPDLTWQVDINWRPSEAVQGRGLDGAEVFVPGTERFLYWGRSSRSGISYQSHRANFVMAGIPAINKLARPAVRDLSLSAWIEAKVREHQLTTQLSAAGHRTALLTRMLGGRRQFVSLFSGPLLAALHGLTPTSSTTTKAYPEHDGVALSSEEGVLSFAGFCARIPGRIPGQVREHLDVALHAGVLRRGLVLQCGTCEQVQFRTVDQIGQTWVCFRCEAGSDLGWRAWKKPEDEPTWFYDLHPVARHLLRDHGDVPALLSTFLASRQDAEECRFEDVAEVEFIRGGNRVVELDLVAYRDDTLIVAECKSNDHLATTKVGARAEVKKKCQAAAWLKADQMVFATTADAWTSGTSAAIKTAVEEFVWGPLGSPEVHLITGLGTATPQRSVIS